jgi:hypothetical protein
MFPLKSERSSSGLLEFPSIAQAVLAIMKCNHTAIESKGELTMKSGKIEENLKFEFRNFSFRNFNFEFLNIKLRIFEHQISKINFSAFSRKF